MGVFLMLEITLWCVHIVVLVVMLLYMTNMGEG